MLQFIERIADHFKSDKQLMGEETALFAVVMANEEREEAGETVERLPKSHYDRQVHQLNILCRRGHRTDDNGGWAS